MLLRRPAYYDQFKCVASACPDSCCKAWAVQIDAESAARYRALPGDLGDTLRASLCLEDGDTILALTDDGRCPMWRLDGLCRIQAELGESALCQVCRDFPRLRHDYGDFVELGLELSCPEAAKLILSGDHALVCRDLPGGETPEYDRQTMDILLESRDVLLTFLSDTTLPVGQALAVMLLYGYAVQNWIDGGEPAVLSPAHALAAVRSLPCHADPHAFLDFFKTLEMLTSQWQHKLNAPQGLQWQEAHRAIARYGVTRYWLQAVSDYDLVSRVKLIAALCLVVKLVGGDTSGTAQLCSKELENDADNIDAILDAAYTSPALCDQNLLGLLMEPLSR